MQETYASRKRRKRLDSVTSYRGSLLVKTRVTERLMWWWWFGHGRGNEMGIVRAKYQAWGSPRVRTKIILI